MKKVLSLITAFILTVMLAIPAFAADAIKFNLTLVSENDTEAVMTIDYAGGSTFNALDFEIKLSNKVSVKSAAKSKGLTAFIDSVEERGQLAISAINKDKNPVIGSLATTVGFNTSFGKDLFKITLKKNTKAKLTADDVKMTVTNCAVSEKAGSTKALSASVTSDLGKAITSAPVTKSTTVTDKNGKTVTTVTTAQEETTVAPNETTTTESEVVVTEDSESISDEVDVLQTVKGNKIADKISSFAKSSGKNKIIIIAAAAICCILFIIAVVIYVVLKTGKKESDENSENNENNVE